MRLGDGHPAGQAVVAHGRQAGGAKEVRRTADHHPSRPWTVGSATSSGRVSPPHGSLTRGEWECGPGLNGGLAATADAGRLWLMRMRCLPSLEVALKPKIRILRT